MPAIPRRAATGPCGATHEVIGTNCTAPNILIPDFLSIVDVPERSQNYAF